MAIKELTAFTTQPGDIAGLTEKTTLAANDVFLIEDSADGNKDKKVLRSSFMNGVSKITVGTSEPSTPATGDLWIDTNA